MSHKSCICSTERLFVPVNDDFNENMLKWNENNISQDVSWLKYFNAERNNNLCIEDVGVYRRVQNIHQFEIIFQQLTTVLLALIRIFFH